jgi:D-glycero-D-manno-heptose 1,7-bisphosphate phosphatase
MHRHLAQAGGHVAAVFYCPHAADADCGCRKPRAGLFEEIGRRFGLPLAGVPAVGDSLRDLEAARSVGARPMLVLTGKGQQTRRNGGLPEGTPIFANLADAVTAIRE